MFARLAGWDGNKEILSVRFDVNGQDGVNSIDSMLVLMKSVGFDMIGTGWQNSSITGDVNCDGIVNVSDAQLLLRKSINLDMNSTNWCG